MTLKDLENGPVKVIRRQGSEKPFMVSMVRGTGGAVGIAPYPVGYKRPRPGTHKMWPRHELDAWLAELDKTKGE